MGANRDPHDLMVGAPMGEIRAIADLSDPMHHLRLSPRP